MSQEPEQRKRTRAEDLSPGEVSDEEDFSAKVLAESTAAAVDTDMNKRMKVEKLKSKWDTDDEDDNKEPPQHANAEHMEVQQEHETSVTPDELGHYLETIEGENPTASSQPGGDEETAAKDDNYNPLINGCRNVKIYEKIKHIDEGSYGVVYKARNTKTNEIVALKKIKFNSADSDRHGFPITALRETNILLALSHPNIVRVKEMVIGGASDIFMVMECMDADLKTVMKTSHFSLAQVKRLMMQLLSAISYMHRCWYIHRDLKTSNLLYSNKGKLVVCDFGMARKYGSPLVEYTPGANAVTLWYRSPELLLGCRVYSTAVDMWSVGCIFAELLKNGQPLFDGTTEDKQIDKIFKLIGQPSEAKWPGCMELPGLKVRKTSRWPFSSSLQKLFPRIVVTGNDLPLTLNGSDLLSNMLNMDPAQRISADDALEQPWFSEQPLPASEDCMPKFRKTS